MSTLYVIVFCFAAVAKSALGACCGATSVLMSPAAYELPYAGYPEYPGCAVPGLPIKAYPYGSCSLKSCSPPSPYVLPPPGVVGADYLAPYGTVPSHDNTVANNLANLLQMLVVSNMLGNALPINKCHPGVPLVPTAVPATCGNAVYW